MYYVYLLQSHKIDKIYIGCAPNLQKRLNEHNAKKVSATKTDTPWALLYFEGFVSKQDAFRREHALKHYGQGLRRLKERLQDTFNASYVRDKAK